MPLTSSHQLLKFFKDRAGLVATGDHDFHAGVASKDGSPLFSLPQSILVSMLAAEEEKALPKLCPLLSACFRERLFLCSQDEEMGY